MAEEEGNPGVENYGNLDALLQKIFEERGYDFRDYKKASIARRISKRLYENHMKTYEEYMDFLDKHPEEYARLFDTLLINVTEFFRDLEAWQVLNDEVIPRILSRKQKGDSIRVWSAGCASGEEAYSIAMLLSDKLGDDIGNYEIRIYATDIDESALNEARKGAYSASKMKSVSKEHLEKYFNREDDTYKVKRSIRQMVAFGRQDLITDAPISHLDLIICRNVLIYFKLELQSRIIIKFHYALNKNGYIFFGKSESMLTGSKLFFPLNKKWRIFEKAAGAIPSMAPAERRATFLEESLIDQAVREARQEFRALEFYNQSILQNISLGIVVVSTDNTIVTWNTGAEDLWGIKTDNAVGRNFFDIGMEERLPGSQGADR
jgi:PAS domain S-box